MKEILVRSSQGPLVALVDDEDFERIATFSWCLSNKGYAVAKKYIGRANKKSQWRYYSMHRVVMNIKDPIDHINCQRLDNRRANLRAATNAQNGQNRAYTRKSVSGYRGVAWDRVHRKWKAKAVLNKRTYNLGFHATAERAHEVVSQWRAQHMPFSSDARAGGVCNPCDFRT